MKILIIIVVIFGLLASGCSTTTYLNLTENNKEQVEQKLNDYEQNEDVGAEITISLNYLTKINGELLSVRESSLIICTEYSATEEVLASLKYPITTVPNDKIKELTIEGNDYTWIGWVGAAAGAGIGVLVGLGTEVSDIISPVVGIGFLGLQFGVLVGSIVGYILSTDDVILQEIPPSYNFSLLKPLARYPDEEPEYLRAIE